MKKLPVYILLFVYAFVQLKPLSVVVQDVIAHTFFQMQHMATVHYENGRYHVHKELKSAGEQERTSSTQKTSSSEKTIENTVPQQVADLTIIHPRVTFVLFSPLSGPGLHEGYLTGTFHPPLQA